MQIFPSFLPLISFFLFNFKVCYSDDGLTLLAALGSGDVAVLDLRMVSKKNLLNFEF